MKRAPAGAAVAAYLFFQAMAAQAQTIDELRGMSINELANIAVSSVTKTAQPLAEAPAAIFVITHDMAVRSGATTVPELMRLAPNLQVYQRTATNYVVTARGHNGNTAAQSFSNKLLVLIDGRSVYSPLYSGVYWDMQDVLPQDIDRIEVVSGPGAALWGANAVNGVINITMRDTRETQGLMVAAQGGAFQRAASLRLGGAAGADANWRVYLRGNEGDETQSMTGVPGGDAWHRLHGGARIDWAPGADDQIMVEGALFGGRHGRLDEADELISGGHVLARWTHQAANGNELQIRGYYDSALRRSVDESSGRFRVDTVDLDMQHSLALGEASRLVWGGDLRLSRYRLDGAGGLVFDPPARTLRLASLFAQASTTLAPGLTFSAGLKLEDDPYTGVSLLPDARLSWQITDGAMLWAAVSRAVRSPTPFDVDVQEWIDDQLLLRGNPAFRTEKLTAFQLGGRFQPTSSLSFSISGYYNRHDDLRSLELSDGGLPLIWGNGLEGESYGVELWGSYRPAEWWTLSASVGLAGDAYQFDVSSSGLLGPSQLGSDPRRQMALRSAMTFAGITLDASLRHVGPLPEPSLPAYTEVDARIGWQVAPDLELALIGNNLLNRWHREYPDGNALPRQVRIGLQWGL